MGKVILVFCLFFTFNSFSQSEVSGVVTSIDGKSIVSASVIAKDTSNKILAYTSTSMQGSFELKLEIQNTVVLYINAIGYEKKSIEISKEYLSQNKTIEIQLLKREFEIKEVIIKKDLPIKIKKDTLVYDAKAFSQGNEKTIEDLLKKIPGINVLSDGTIKFGDQEIEKIMVEGDDFFEKGYSILTKNMPSSPLEKIEVYKNYSNNKLLKGIEKSNKVALNLKLKKESKNVLFGNVDLGSGFFSENKYDVKSNIMNFGIKHKIYITNNLNNIGIDNTSGIYNLHQSTLDDFNKLKLNNFTPLQSLNFGMLNFEAKRTNFNNLKFVSINDIFVLSKKSKIKFNIAFNADAKYFESATNTISYASNATYENNEIFYGRKKTNFIFTKLHYALDIGKNSALEYQIKYSMNKAKQSSDVYFNTVPIQQKLKDKNSIFNSEFKITQKINSKNIFTYNLNFNSETFPQNYFSDTNIFQNLIPISFTAFDQNTNQKRNNFGANVNLLAANTKQNIMTISLGAYSSYERLISNLEDLTSFQNNIAFQTQMLFFKFSYNYTFKKFSILAENQFNWFKNRSSNPQETIQDNKLFVNPNLNLNYTFNEKSKIYTTHSLNNSNVEVRNIPNNYIVSGFNTISDNKEIFTYVKNMQNLLGYNFSIPKKKISSNILLIYRKDFQYQSKDLSLFQNYNISSNIYLKNSENITVNVALEKYFRVISSNFKVTSNTTKSTYQKLFDTNNTIAVTNYNSYFGLELRSGFQGFFNYNLGSSWQNNKVTSVSINTFNSITSFLNLDFRFSNKLLISLRNENYFYNLQSHKNKYAFFDINTDYKISESLNINFTVTNLFNQNIFVTRNITDFEVSTFSYKLIPRFAMIKFEYRF